MENGKWGPRIEDAFPIDNVIFHGDLLVYRSVRKGSKIIIQKGRVKHQFFVEKLVVERLFRVYVYTYIYWGMSMELSNDPLISWVVTLISWVVTLISWVVTHLLPSY